MNTVTRGADGITIKSLRELNLMREAGKVVAEAKVAVRNAIQPGATSREMDALAEEVIRGRGAIPSFKGYKPTSSKPFPATICFSFNEEIVHGIPGDRKMREKRNEEWIEKIVICPDCVKGRIQHWKERKSGKPAWRYHIPCRSC